MDVCHFLTLKGPEACTDLLKKKLAFFCKNDKFEFVETKFYSNFFILVLPPKLLLFEIFIT